MKRNEFVKNAGLATAAFAIQPNTDIFSRSASAPIKLGVIGVGQRGRGHLKNLLLRKKITRKKQKSLIKQKLKKRFILKIVKKKK